MSGDLRTRVVSFGVASDGMSVDVNTDPDLGVKFKRGEVLRGDSGSIEVAMVLGIDETNTTRIDVSESSIGLRSILEEVRDAVAMALDGCPRT